MLDFGAPTLRRRPSLTPMIDVVFLLLVFFMLAARFGLDQVIEIRPSETSAESTGYTGAPRLIEIGPDALRLNGVVLTADLLPQAVMNLMPGPDAVVILRSDPEATVQNMVEALDLLHGSGIANTVIIE